MTFKIKQFRSEIVLLYMYSVAYIVCTCNSLFQLLIIASCMYPGLLPRYTHLQQTTSSAVTPFLFTPESSVSALCHQVQNPSWLLNPGYVCTVDRFLNGKYAGIIHYKLENHPPPGIRHGALSARWNIGGEVVCMWLTATVSVYNTRMSSHNKTWRIYLAVSS